MLKNMYGVFPHDDMIGRAYGSKVSETMLMQIHSNNKKGFVYVLRPSPELWTLALPHRTQILYAPDMSFITMKLNISPGASVVEAGTGSGSFTHFLARTVARGPPAADHQGQTTFAWQTQRSESAPKSANAAHEGRVYSFEFHAERVDKARAEFAAHGLDSTVVLQHRNVCKDGFGLEGQVDAVFLDLPAPWEAIAHAKTALRTDVATRICCFSPCIEQVLRTVAALAEHGFTDITMYESLVRTHESLTNVAPQETITSVVERIRQTQTKRESRRQMQIANSRADRERRLAEKLSSETEGAKEAAEVDEVPAPPLAPASAEPGANPTKRKADDLDDHADSLLCCEQEPPADMLYSSGFRQKVERRTLERANVYSRPYPQMRGHTSYLTFAMLLPQST